ncbi:hypothetical protein EKN56_06270 [Limnobaculum zhutongyuii]|uniref:Putative tail fiber protein gp53-like C-terminal domain-containing protein n=1 Tax=Limnobaculum zhutongyuii TaxID=2498113 RepID=A0A411WIN2_9GAMM|nr:phage tail protein [Limnobaculum zhutongyuii]QBH95781.1 hypothetical protein EKN56_04820 [Limnobaculum zhutongyuii]QBH96036.1 hypothetical protein EKN56_06270 [Limnobaculum zhutongyuii]TQS86125.1 hypothetical protein ELQ32_20380 [Limnobaculum zhutongyuii]
MADLPEQEAWEGVRQLETSDRALGGPGGVMNAPLRNLTNRTAYLKKALDGKTGAASTTTAGIVKLSSATNSDSSTDAATASAVKKAYDLADSKLSSIPFATVSEVLDGGSTEKVVNPKTLQSKGNFYSNVSLLTTSKITTAQFGARFWVDYSSPSAYTLPDISNIVGCGQTITIWNVKDTNITISVGNSSNSISIPMSTVTTLTLKPTESATFIVEQVKVWHATGDAVLRLAPSWSFNPAFNGGWQKLPSGLIIQWGGVSTISGDTTTMLPVTFPTAFLHAAVTMDYTPASGAVTYIAACPGSRSTIVSRTASPGLGGRYIAIGY